MTDQRFDGPVDQVAGRDVNNNLSVRTLNIDARGVLAPKVARTLGDLPTAELREMREHLARKIRTNLLKARFSWPVLLSLALIPVAFWNLINTVRSLLEPVSLWPIYALLIIGFAGIYFGKARTQRLMEATREDQRRLGAIDRILRERVD